MAESIITDKMRAAIGVESVPVTEEVEKGAIIRFAQAIGDQNPLFTDEAAARKSRYGGLIAPPTFLRSVIAGPPTVEFEQPYSAGLDGGSEWEYFEPVRPGDRITHTVRITDLFEREGPLGQHALRHHRGPLREPVRNAGRPGAVHRNPLRAVKCGVGND